MTVVIPTGARVIDIDLDTVETNIFKNVPFNTNEQFYSTDIGMAFLKFTGLEQDYTGCTARLSLINFNDGSKVQRIFEMDTTTTFVYPMLETELAHAGRWIGQIAIIKNGTTISDNPFRFKIDGTIMTTALISFDNINIFTSQLTTIYDGLNTFLDAVILDESGRSDAEGLRVVAEGLRVTAEQLRVIADALRETKEGIRQATFEANEITRDGIVNSLVTAQTIAQKVAEKYQLIESTQANRLLSAEQQLEQKADWINVKSLGAIGDGLTDCSALINASIIEGTTLFIPKGIFLADILVAVPRVTICGEGTIKGSVKVDLPVVDNIQPDARFEIRDVDFEKNLNPWAIRLANARIGSIKNVTTSEAFTYPVYYDEASTYSQRTAKIRITDSFLFGDYGIYLKESLAAFGAADIQVHNTQFLNKVSNIHLEHVDGFIESGNTLFMTGYGKQSTVKKHNVYADFINWGKFGSGSNYFEAGLESIFITRFQNTVISGLSIAWPGQRVQSDAIKLTNGGISGDYIGVSIVSNITILFPTKHGIETDANITDLLIDNIVVRGAGSASYYYGVPALTGTCYGVLIPAFSVDKFVMVSNVMSPLNLCSITNRATAKNIMDSSGFYDITATEDFTATGARIIPSKKGVKIFNLSNAIATNVTSISEAFYQIGSEVTLIAYNSNTTLVHDVAEIALTGKVNLLMQAYTAYKFMWTGAIWIQV